ncbi:hypothetical protein GCM10009020_01080 [Natronoarchaeum mannanilyticum]|uniref:Uncharacterized protein n=2 Tax=Natronoarchaeum mannanilyticum TaxID=926360 RepID=A0AAV3T5E9_9EURY
MLEDDSDGEPNETDPDESDPSDSAPNETEPEDSDPNESESGEPHPVAFENPSFENGLNGWTVGTDLPEEPGDSTEKVDHGVTTVDRRASDGDASVEFYLDGSADDGTVWVAQTVDLSDVESVSVDVYNDEESFNILTQVAFYAGEKSSSELVEVDFDRDNDVEAHSGWKTFSYDVGDVDGAATVAVGMNIVWETDVRHVFDNVRLD